VFLVGEYKISNTCPACCTGGIEAFRYVSNPRLFHRRTMHAVRCHMLPKCFNGNYLKFVVSDCAVLSSHPRLWNCDLAAVSNFCHVLFGLRENDNIPE
ncbi:hypothetical protein BX070DRAFT_188764, partial [Coemansia spiralis]